MVQATSRGPGKTAYWLISLALGLAVMGTNVPSPLYEVYAREWGFSSGVVTLIFAVYCLVLIASLLLFGRFSDELGRRRVLLVGLTGIASGSLLFAMAPSVAWLLAARAVQGIAVGVISGAATAALAELHPRANRRAAALAATVALTGMAALGPLFGGLMAEYAPWPLVLAYLVHFGLMGLVIIGVWLIMPETVPVKPKAQRSLRPRRARVPSGVRYPFALGSTACFVGWAVASLFLSLVPSYATALLGLNNLAVGGAAVSVMLGCACGVQVLLKEISPSQAMISGMGTLIAGMATIVAAVPLQSVWLLLAGAILNGAGLGLAFMGGMGLVGQVAPAESRAEVLSACYVISYLGESLPILGVGYGVDRVGLYPAVVTFAALIGVLGLLTAVLAVCSKSQGIGE